MSKIRRTILNLVFWMTPVPFAALVVGRAFAGLAVALNGVEWGINPGMIWGMVTILFLLFYIVCTLIAVLEIE